MRNIDLLFAVAFVGLMTLLVGCKPPEGETGYKVDDRQLQTGRDVDVARDGLQMALVLDQRSVQIGGTLDVKAIVHNGSDAPITINSTSSALVKLFLWRDSVVGMTKMKTWPQAAAMVMSPWTLEPGDKREFMFDIPVDRTWPSGEVVWLSAHVNGREDLRPQLYLEVLPEKQAETE